MRNTRQILGLGLFVTLLACVGCVVPELRNDQDKIRTALLELYTNQIIDNLIRASNGMPIIQLDYTNATGTVTLKETANISDSAGNSGTNVLALPAKALSLTQTIVSTLSGGATGEHTNQVAVTATPVTTMNEVYDAYLEFLSLPQSLCQTDDPPPEGAAHICRRYCKKYYWVPCNYKVDFLKLSLLTTAQRGKSLLAPPDYFSITLKSMTHDEPGQFEGTRLLTIRIDGTVPNDSGYLEFVDNNVPVRYTVKPFQADNGDEPSTTREIVVVFSPEASTKIPTVDALIRKFDLAAKLYLQHKQPKPATTDDLLQNMRFQLEQIRFNQLR